MLAWAPYSIIKNHTRAWETSIYTSACSSENPHIKMLLPQGSTVPQRDYRGWGPRGPYGGAACRSSKLFPCSNIDWYTRSILSPNHCLFFLLDFEENTKICVIMMSSWKKKSGWRIQIKSIPGVTSWRKQERRSGKGVNKILTWQVMIRAF